MSLQSHVVERCLLAPKPIPTEGVSPLPNSKGISPFLTPSSPISPSLQKRHNGSLWMAESGPEMAGVTMLQFLHCSNYIQKHPLDFSLCHFAVARSVREHKMSPTQHPCPFTSAMGSSVVSNSAVDSYSHRPHSLSPTVVPLSYLNAFS